MTSTSSAQPLNLAQQLLQRHLVSGELTPGSEIALRIDQALLQDVLGTLVMLELEAMGARSCAYRAQRAVHRPRLGAGR